VKFPAEPRLGENSSWQDVLAGELEFPLCS
jgi:hypothetical protein